MCPTSGAEAAAHISLQEEIRTIVKKRNDFEHRVLSPGNQPSEWSSYAHWEQSLESLRRKRCNRLKIRHLNSAHAGQGRVLSIYERAVNRHPGSGALWREYLSYTASIKAAKRWRRIMTNALRMKPTDAELWVMAGRRSAHNGDMAAARGFFMRGCRFCNSDCALWLEYARCEIEWLEKMERKKRNQGNKALLAKVDDEQELRLLESDDEDEQDGNALLPEPSKAQAKTIDKHAAQQLSSNPAMDGAIALAIFDISQKQPFFDASAAEQFFDLFASFRSIAVQPRISQHVLETLDDKYPESASTCNCYIRQPILGLNPFTPEFPHSLRDVLARLDEKMKTTKERDELKEKTGQWIDGYLALEGLDEGIKTVLEHTKRRLGLTQENETCLDIASSLVSL